MSLYDKIHGSSQGASAESHILSAKSFLGLVGESGYTNPKDFISYAFSLRKDEVIDLEMVIFWLKMGHRIDNQTKRRVDKGGRTYAYPRFTLSKNSSPGGKVILEAGMDRLINDYAAGLIQVDFTLDELVEEALNP